MYYVHTMPGIEPIAWDEISTRFPGSSYGSRKLVPDKNGLLLFRSDAHPQDLLDLRCAEDLFFVAARGFKVAGGPQGLRQIYAAIRSSKDIGDALATWEDIYGDLQFPATFRVVVRETSSNLMRRDIGRAVTDAVLDGWPGRWRQVDEEADVELWVNLLDTELLCGLRLSRADMRHRDYKLQHLPASLRPSVAAAMVFLTRPAANDVFLDPMAGAGTILLERAAAGPFAQLLGGDNSDEALDALERNTYALRGNLQVRGWDARVLPLDDDIVDKAAVNLPFGRQVNPGENLRALYSDVLTELTRVLRPGGALVLLTSDLAALDVALRANPTLRDTKRYPVNVLGLDAVITVLARRKDTNHRDTETQRG